MSTADLPSMPSPAAGSSSATGPSPAAQLLDVPELRERVHLISVAQYQKFGERGLIDRKTELIRGVIVNKMRQSPLHCYLVQTLLKWLTLGVGDGWLVRAADPITTQDSEPEPDLSVVAGDTDDYLTQHPQTAALAIEVSVSSEKLDRQKAAIYAEAGVNEYWIVLAEQRLVEIYLKPQDGRYTQTKSLGADDVLRPEAFTPLELPVAELFPPQE